MNTVKTDKKITLTSVNQVISLIQGNAALLELPRFVSLKALEPSTSAKKSCNCGTKKNFTAPDLNKQLIEGVLSSLTLEDFGQIKDILGLSQLFYYKRSSESNKLELVCV